VSKRIQSLVLRNLLVNEAMKSKKKKKTKKARASVVHHMCTVHDMCVALMGKKGNE
jgi:hypothetical protein